MPSEKLPDNWAGDVLRFWFEELNPQDWFSGGVQVDEQIRHRFAGLYAAMNVYPPALQGVDASTLLAAVIAFDQFPRHLFRNTPEAYATDGKALALARHAVASGKDRLLTPVQRNFLYLPFMHSEDLAAQAESLRLVTELGMADAAKWARHHHDVLKRFGRFPHRNAILGRRSTPEEEEFLKTSLPGAAAARMNQ